MAWIFIEGLDRSGKSTFAKMYEKRGYALVHLSAPDKKYFAPGYAGPAYLDELLDIYMKYNSVDAVFDRTAYGETVWPLVYGRKSQLDDEAFEILREIENNNSTEYYLFYDSNVEAHWKRCVDNKEPLNKNQFNQAGLLFDRLAAKFNFTKVQLSDLLQSNNVNFELSDDEKKRLENTFGKPSIVYSNDVSSTSTTRTTINTNDDQLKVSKTPEQIKLERANAINDVLSKRILKQKGVLFDSIENDIRDFLNTKLGTIMGNSNNSENPFSKDEINILKLYCQQLKKKMESK